MPRRKQILGYEVCIHTCNGEFCDTGSQIVWPKEGSGCLRHASNVDKHPKCNSECLGSSSFWGKPSRWQRARDATIEEISKHLGEAIAEAETLRRAGMPQK